jgi:hypothetical protein
MDNKSVELLIDIHKEISITRADQASMKADLREHIRRTNMLEERLQHLHDTDLKWLKKHVWMAYGAIGLISFALTALKILK